MREVIQCPICSCKIRRQNQTTKQMVARFTRHILHYHHDFKIEGEVE